MNWIYKGKEIIEQDIPKNAYGFTYILTLQCKGENYGKFYIGKKALTHRKKKRISKKVIKSTKTRKRIDNQIVKSDWEIYTGSSREFNELLKKVEYNKYPSILKKEILDFYPDKFSLSLGEVKAIVCEDRWLNEKCLNKWISCRIYKNKLI